VDRRTDKHWRPTLLGGLGGVDLMTHKTLKRQETQNILKSQSGQLDTNSSHCITQ